jgi:lipid II:glycine glycyltransferase (peptidoglycan interpeptide bridge formation enzyme)
MFQVFAQAKGYHPTLLAALNQENEITALFIPVQITLMEGLLRPLTTRAIAYGSVLCSPGVQGSQGLAALLNAYSQSTRNKVLFTEMRNLSDLSVLQPVFLQSGFEFEQHLNYLINLNRTPVEVLKNIGPRTRKHIRQALRKGTVIVEEFSDPSLLSGWYELVRKSYKNARVPLADSSLFRAAFNILRPRGMAQFWIARIGSTCVAASMELVYKDIIYGWYSGIDRAYSSEAPGELLMWHVLEKGARNGYRMYDFGGAGRPDEKSGVRDFKAKFGGQMVCYGRNIKVHSPGLLRWSEKGYQVYRQLIGGF